MEVARKPAEIQNSLHAYIYVCVCVYKYIYIYIYIYKGKKGKVFSLQARCGPEAG